MPGRRLDVGLALEHSNQRNDGGDNQQERAEQRQPNSARHANAGRGDVDVNRTSQTTDRRTRDRLCRCKSKR